MEKSNKDLIFAGLVVIVIVFLFAIIPYIFMGPPTSLFSIRNLDDVTHEITVEIHPIGKGTMFEGSYILSANGEISEPKSVSFLIGKTLPLDNEYVANVTLDGNVSETYYSELGRWETVEIEINDELSVYSSVV